MRFRRGREVPSRAVLEAPGTSPTVAHAHIHGHQAEPRGLFKTPRCSLPGFVTFVTHRPKEHHLIGQRRTGTKELLQASHQSKKTHIQHRDSPNPALQMKKIPRGALINLKPVRGQHRDFIGQRMSVFNSSSYSYFRFCTRV